MNWNEMIEEIPLPDVTEKEFILIGPYNCSYEEGKQFVMVIDKLLHDLVGQTIDLSAIHRKVKSKVGEIEVLGVIEREINDFETLYIKAKVSILPGYEKLVNTRYSIFGHRAFSFYAKSQVVHLEKIKDKYPWLNSYFTKRSICPNIVNPIEILGFSLTTEPWTADVPEKEWMDGLQ